MLFLSENLIFGILLIPSVIALKYRPVPPTSIGTLSFLTILLIFSAASLSHFPVEKTAPED